MEISVKRMKFKKTSKVLVLLFISFLGILGCVQLVKAQTGTYQQKIDPLDPFSLTVDTIYSMSSSDYRMKNDSFHQAILDGDNYYVFYLKSNLVRYNMTVWIQISDASESYFREDCGDGEYELLMIFRPQKTALFNITLSNRNYNTPDDLYFQIDEIGILEVPEYIFTYNNNYNRYETEIEEKWDSQYIVFGIAHLERFVDYKIQSGHEIYKGYLGQYSLLGSVKLNGDNSFEEQYTEGETLNVSAEADYLFYEILGNPFSIYYQESPTQEPFAIPGYSLLITLSCLVMISLIFYKKKFKS